MSNVTLFGEITVSKTELQVKVQFQLTEKRQRILFTMYQGGAWNVIVTGTSPKLHGNLIMALADFANMPLFMLDSPSIVRMLYRCVNKANRL